MVEFREFRPRATYFLHAQIVGKDAPTGGPPIVSLPLDSLPAAPKGCCDTPLETPGSVSGHSDPVHRVENVRPLDVDGELVRLAALDEGVAYLVKAA